MTACERCWSQSGGDSERYAELVKTNDCTPEQEAGRHAGLCPECERYTLHQYVKICMNSECNKKEKP